MPKTLLDQEARNGDTAKQISIDKYITGDSFEKCMQTHNVNLIEKSFSGNQFMPIQSQYCRMCPIKQW